jgi:hypothetical protein
MDLSTYLFLQQPIIPQAVNFQKLQGSDRADSSIWPHGGALATHTGILQPPSGAVPGGKSPPLELSGTANSGSQCSATQHFLTSMTEGHVLGSLTL